MSMDFGFFDQKQEISTSFGNGANTLRDILLEVSGYDLTGETPLVIGTDVSTGNECRIGLRFPKNKDMSNATTVEALAGKVISKMNRHVRENGLIIFFSCYEVSEGVWSSKYASTVNHGRDLTEKEFAELAKKRVQLMPSAASISNICLDSIGRFFTVEKADKLTVGAEILILNDKHIHSLLSDYAKAALGRYVEHEGEKVYRPFVPVVCKNVDQAKSYIDVLNEHKFGSVTRLKAERDEQEFMRVYTGDRNSKSTDVIGELLAQKDTINGYIKAGAVLEVIPTITVFATKTDINGDNHLYYEKGTNIPSNRLQITRGSFAMPKGTRRDYLYTKGFFALRFLEKIGDEIPENFTPTYFLKGVQADYNADRYTSLAVSAFFAETKNIKLNDPDSVIESQTNLKLAEVKFTAEAVRTANGFMPKSGDESLAAIEQLEDEAQQAIVQAKVGAYPTQSQDMPEAGIVDDDIPF